MRLKKKSNVPSANSPLNIIPIGIRCLTLSRDLKKYLRLMLFSQIQTRGNNMTYKALKVLSNNTSRRISSTEEHSEISFQSLDLMQMISLIESSEEEVSPFNRINNNNSSIAVVT